MTPQLHKAYRNPWRVLALATAAMLLYTQLLAVSHVHQQPSPIKRISSSSQAAPEDGLCALCLFHFHAQASFSATPTLGHPVPTTYAQPAVDRHWIASSQVACLFGRAPPVSA